MTSEELGRRVREAREAAGLSQTELGAKLQPPRSHAAISDIERGVSRVGATDIAQIARILEQSAAFFYGEDEPSPKTAVYGRGDVSKELKDRFSQAADEYLKHPPKNQ